MSAANYAPLATFKSLTIMPSGDVDQLQTKNPGWIDAQGSNISGFINARLRKLYTIPFSSPYPDIVVRWTVLLLTEQCYLKRGVDPSDQTMQRITELAKSALDEIKEAADGFGGRFDLPLISDNDESARSKIQTLSSSCADPYSWIDE
jgi:hypothetical protein